MMNILMRVHNLQHMSLIVPSQLDLICLYKVKEQDKFKKNLIKLIVNKIINTKKCKDNNNSIDKNILIQTKYQKIKTETQQI